MGRGILRRKVAETPCTSMRILRTQNSYFERFTQQISSLSTEQSRVRVKSSVKRPNDKEPTSESFAAEKNEQLLKKVKTQEVDYLVRTPRNDDPASGNGLRECLQSIETLEKSIQCTKVCEDASFWKRISIGTCYKTIADVSDGFGDRTPASREHTHPPDPYSIASAAIPGRTIIGPVIQVHIMQPLGSHGLEIQILSQTNPDRKSQTNPVASPKSRTQSRQF